MKVSQLRKKNLDSIAPKVLVLAMASVITSISNADVNRKMIGDLEIYQAPKQGAATITMMLDTSGSMAFVDTQGIDVIRTRRNEYLCRYGYASRVYVSKQGRLVKVPIFDKKGVVKGSVQYAVRGCPKTPRGSFQVKVDGNGHVTTTSGYMDRLSRVKIAMVGLLADARKLENKHKIGMGNYSYQGDGDSGVIAQPAKPLSVQHRLNLIKYIINLRAAGGTPSANAYAEAGAYMMGTTTQGLNKSGFPYANTNAVKGNNYISPINKKDQCAGYGIYFLTDGEPNSSNYGIASRLMNSSLGNKNFFSGRSVPTPLPRYNAGEDTDCVGTLPFDTYGGAWGCMGEYSKLLKKTDNPSGRPIKTAAVGFGSSYLNSNGQTPTKENPDKTSRKKTIVDCEKLTKSVSAKNLCKLSERSYGYGEGGFTATNDPEVLAQSVVDFLEELNEEIDATPSGTIVVPEDPYNASRQQAVAYYPSVKANVAGGNFIWLGNMKKYGLNEGTLYGKNDTKLFLDIAGTLNSAAEDLWSDKSHKNNTTVTNGGFYAQLLNPATGVASVRSLFIEDWTSSSDKTPRLRKLSVSSAGKITLDNKLLSSSFFNDKKTYTDNRIKSLLGFLGFTNLPKQNVKDVTLTVSKNTSKAIKVLGATMHSTPALVSYSAQLDDIGRVTSNRDEYVLFGSMDGALHLVDADDYGVDNGGKEKFAFIPKEILINQSEALVNGSTRDRIGSPVLGIDAPWLVTAKYKYGNSSVSGKKVFAYGGMRLGGQSFYGMDLTDKDQPKLKFVLNNSVPGFERVGNIWSQPTKAKIKTKDNDKGIDVLVFGGGYDTCYENEDFQVSSATEEMKDHTGTSCKKTAAQGNAVYIVNANDGKLIWSTSNSGAISNNKAIVNSVVGGITVLDRDDDGFMDHLYFADLGGQIFRADFKNAGFINKDKSKESGFSNTRVIRILKNDSQGKFARRFYEKPIVSFYRNPKNKSHLFAMVNAISGDRSSPVSKLRKKLVDADRVYGLIDKDVTKLNSQLFSNDFEHTVKDIQLSDLYNLSKDPNIKSVDDDNTLQKKKGKIVDGLQLGEKKGWYYPLIRFDGYNKVRYTKGIGKSAVINSFLFTTVYNPDMDYSSGASCSAKVLGGSERQLYCLPYGVCMDNKSKTGTGGFIPAGQGIQELTLGPRSKSRLDQTLLIGTRSIGDQLKGRKSFNKDKNKNKSKIKDQLITDPADPNKGRKPTQEGGDGSAPVLLFNERYTLTPNKWYESNE